MYKVIKAFYDLDDCVRVKGGVIYHSYAVGDVYPREGVDPSLERYAELAGKYNKQGQPLIKKIGGVDFKSMTKSELLEYGKANGYIIDAKARKAEIIDFLTANDV